jgi:hypothetical protein
MINYRLGSVPINNPTISRTPTENARYETALIENFVIDTDRLEAEIAEVNGGNAAVNGGNAAVNGGNAAVNAAVNGSNAAANNVAEKIKEAINSQNNLSNNLIYKTDATGSVYNNIVDKENTISDKFIVDEDNIFDMMKKLDDVEVMCSKLDKEQKLKDDLEQIHINKSSIQELNNQEKRIEELSNIVQHLRREKEKRDIISNKCRVKQQVKLDGDYDKVKDLVKKGFLKDERRQINIKLPEDGLKFDMSGIPAGKANGAAPAGKANGAAPAGKANGAAPAGKANGAAPAGKANGAAPAARNRSSASCARASKKTGFDLNKLNNGVCYGCDANVLKKHVGKINRDFGNGN